MTVQQAVDVILKHIKKTSQNDDELAEAVKIYIKAFGPRQERENRRTDK